MELANPRAKQPSAPGLSCITKVVVRRRRRRRHSRYCKIRWRERDRQRERERERPNIGCLPSSFLPSSLACVQLSRQQIAIIARRAQLPLQTPPPPNQVHFAPPPSHILAFTPWSAFTTLLLRSPLLNCAISEIKSEAEADSPLCAEEPPPSFPLGRGKSNQFEASHWLMCHRCSLAVKTWLRSSALGQPLLAPSLKPDLYLVSRVCSAQIQR